MQKIEENNRMGKTTDLFRKIRDAKGTFHAKMGSIKDRNGRDRLQPYHPEHAQSRLILEAKQGRACLVLGWEKW